MILKATKKFSTEDKTNKLSHQDKNFFVSDKADEQKQATKHGLLNLKAYKNLNLYNGSIL